MRVAVATADAQPWTSRVEQLLPAGVREHLHAQSLHSLHCSVLLLQLVVGICLCNRTHQQHNARITRNHLASPLVVGHAARARLSVCCMQRPLPGLQLVLGLLLLHPGATVAAACSDRWRCATAAARRRRAPGTCAHGDSRPVRVSAHPTLWAWKHAAGTHLS
jgi:hypothetical protein